MTKVLWNFSLVNCVLNQVDGRKFGKFTEQPIMKNIKAPNWQIKVWRILLICQIHQAKFPPNFCRLWYRFVPLMYLNTWVILSLLYFMSTMVAIKYTSIRKIVILQSIGIIIIKSKETRVVTYTCKYSSGHLIPIIHLDMTGLNAH